MVSWDFIYIEKNKSINPIKLINNEFKNKLLKVGNKKQINDFKKWIINLAQSNKIILIYWIDNYLIK